MVRQGEILAEAFDRVFLYEDSCLRGRAPGEITALLRRGLAVGPRVREFHEHPEPMKAVEASLRELQAGDLLIVQADDVDATIAFIKNYLRAEAPGREVDLAEMIEVAESRDAVTAGRSWDEGPGQSHLLDVHARGVARDRAGRSGTPATETQRVRGGGRTEPLPVFERTSLVPDLRG